MRQLKITKGITNREEHSLDIYLQEIAREILITPEEEVILAQKIKQGDQQALEKLSKANLRFVVSVAKQYQNQGLSLPDLINEGNLGLIKAAKRFDETRGFKFISYAVWRIRQGILEAINEQRIVRRPTNIVSGASKVKKKIAILEQKFERPPTNQEIAEVLEISEDKVREYSFNPISVSFDAIVEGTDSSLLDIFEDPENTENDSPDYSVIYKQSIGKEIDRIISTLLSSQENNILM
jgi:RNA polymerase primary sigma factor